MITGLDSGPKPVVLVDATSLNRRMKGVGRYTWHLCEALSRELPTEAQLVLAVFDGELPDFPAGFRGRWQRSRYYSELRLGFQVLPRLIRETGAGVFIRPADKIGRSYSVPTLTICHDVNPLIWAAQASRPVLRKVVDSVWERLRGHALRRSDHVICNSEFVRQAAIRRFGLNSRRVSVGYCGVDRRIPELAARVDVARVSSRFGQGGFLLAFATGDEREGFQLLPELWAAARKAGYPGTLVIAGVKDEADYARKLRLDFQSKGENGTAVYLPFLGEERIGELAGLYRAADFYLETSRHEGFGMQLIEAMACGTTCFSSGRGALAEIGGGFPLAMNITDPAAAGEAIAAAWRAGLHERDNALQMAHALKFDWQDTCAQVVRFTCEQLGALPR